MIVNSTSFDLLKLVIPKAKQRWLINRLVEMELLLVLMRIPKMLAQFCQI